VVDGFAVTYFYLYTSEPAKPYQDLSRTPRSRALDKSKAIGYNVLLAIQSLNVRLERTKQNLDSHVRRFVWTLSFECLACHSDFKIERGS
jgi:hypothetical protein